MPAALEPKQERSRETRRLLLDAAVEELLARGYAGLTTLAVAQRAGVSRGAQQNHFPSKATLVAEALRHLADREMQQILDAVKRAPADEHARARRVLDVVFEHFSGPLFATVVELSLAARDAPELRDVVEAQERAMAGKVEELGREAFGARMSGDRRFAARWGTAVTAVRGTAVLGLLGHEPAAVRRHWSRTRTELVGLLVEG